MAERKPFLVRLDPATHEALQRWAAADMRSVNAQVVFLLQRALREAGRLPVSPAPADAAAAETQEDER